jgi:arginyl-tRNA synthetase
MAGWLHYSSEKRSPKRRQVGFDLVLGSNGKWFRTRSIEVVRSVKLLDEAKCYGSSCAMRRNGRW